MRRRSRIIALLSFAASLAVAAYLWYEAGRVPVLSGPLRLVDASALADGGTMWVAVVDTQGTWFGFGVNGSIGVPRARFPAVVRRWESLPLLRSFPPGDARELELARIARRAAADNIAETHHALFLLQLAETLEDRPRHNRRSTVQLNMAIDTDAQGRLRLEALQLLGRHSLLR